MSWSNPYIGLPWARLGRDHVGVDCWGLVYLVYREQLGIELPDYLQVPTGTGEMARQVDAIASTDPWTQVDEPRDFDVAVFRMGSLLRHVGLIAGPGLMLHVTEGGMACMAPLDHPRWQSRLLGFSRYGEVA